MRFGVVLLAAGESSRLGRPKQLLPYEGSTLVGHAARVALDSSAEEVVVVLGASAVEVREALGDLPVRTVVNESFPEGMGGSIRVGVGALEGLSREPRRHGDTEGLDGAIVTLVDQPRVTSEHLKSLVAGLGDASIVASSYDGVLGAPCAFRREEFPALLALKGDVGARAFLRGEAVVSVPFAGGQFDIDTPEDASRLQ